MEKDTILLMESDPEQIQRLETILDGLGYHVDFCQNPTEVADRCIRQSFQFLVLEAGKDTLESVRRLRNVKKNKNTPILFLIKQPTQQALLEKLININRADFLMEPFSESTIKFRLDQLKNIHQHDLADLEHRTQLKEEIELLQAQNDEMRSFVGIVAHDLRAPIGRLINIAEVLNADPDPSEDVDLEELRAMYALLHKTSKRCFNLVNDILDLTAIESGKIQLNLRKCDIWPLAIQIINELNYLAKDKQITLVNDISDALEVRADGRRIFQVLGNLVTNAIKFTPPGGTVTLSADVHPDGIQIEVKDTGVGIPQDKVRALFSKHQKASTPGTAGERGTGYGLPLAQQLIHAHGSEIAVTSEVGIGSCFSFKLPWWAD